MAKATWAASVGLAALACGLGSAARAQSGGVAAEATASLEEVVVTAQKRTESVQDVPLAVTALSGDQLARAGATNVEGLQAVVPNLNLGQQLGVARIALRGVGLDNLSTGAEGSIALHVNGVFLSRSAAALSSFYDLDRVEVLRGPQGTLYGRNATGGSINLITRRPAKDLSGYFDVTGGNYDRLAFEGALNVAPRDDVAVRLAFQTNEHSGYGHNIVTGHGIDDAETRAARLSVLYTPADDTELLVVGDYYRGKDHANGYHFLGAGGLTASGQPVVPFGILFGGAVAPNSRDIANETDPVNRREIWGVSADLKHVAGDWTFRSISAYRFTKYATDADLDSTSFTLAPIRQTERASQVSEELQALYEGQRVRGIVGAYYFDERITGGISDPTNDIIFGGPGILRQGYFAGGKMHTTAAALFGQATYEFTDRLSLTVGGRYGWERKSVVDLLQFDLARPYVPGAAVLPLALCAEDAPSVPGCQPHKIWRSFTPKASLEFKMNPDTLIYGSVSRGFKSGTYNLGGVRPPIEPEKVTAYEAGLKSEFLDRRVRANLAAFYYDYKNLQVGKVVGATLALENAATARIYGTELEVRARPAAPVELGLTASLLHARFTDFVSVDPARPAGDGRTFDNGVPAFDNSGNTLPQAPNWTLSLYGEYTWTLDGGDLTLRGDAAWMGKVYYSAFNRPEVAEGERTKLNASAEFRSRDEHIRVTAFVRNILDKTYVSNAFVSSGLVGFPINGFLEAPRTYGVSLRYSY